MQAGHWLTDQVPPELGRLQAGSVGGGKQEWQVNLDVAQRTAALLESVGVQVDVLPAQGINVYDIMRREKLVLTRAAIEALEARFK